VSDELVRFCEGNREGAAAMGLSGGEDYELLFTVAPGDVEKVEALGERGDLPQLARIGLIETGEGELLLESEEGERSALKPEGSHHFGGTTG
jgi:thiamine-monophosphate kinase